MARERPGAYKDLLVWKEAMALAKACHFVTQDFPKQEIYGLTPQIKRASASIAANIAEGSGRGSKKEFIQFLRISKGSLREVETYLLLSADIYPSLAEHIDQVIEKLNSVSFLLVRLIKSLETPVSSNPQTSQTSQTS